MEIKKYVVSNDKTIYEAWPDIIQTNRGKLICVFSECEHHCDRTHARIVWVESTDKGHTWSEKNYLTERAPSSALYFNCARISKLQNGRLAIICDRIHGDENGLSEIFIWFGDEEGTEWGEPMQLPFCGIVPDRLTQLKNGRLLLGAHFQNPATGKLEQYLWYSDDNAKTWSERVTVAADPRYNLCEVSILECRDGTLVAFLRENSGMGYDCLKAISHDSGTTWEGVYSMAIPGCHRPTTGFLKDGRILLTYRYFPGGKNSDRNMFGAIFDEESAKATQRKEQEVITFPIDYDRHKSPDGGYTGWTELDDGEVYVVNYIKDDEDKAQIRGYRFRYTDLIL